MGITNSNKELSVASINCDGSFQVKLSLTAAPDIVTHPTDIVLILDRSGSMAGSALANLKNGAKAFIDIISDATGGAQDGQIGSGSRIGIVSFADTVVKDTQLITSASDLKAAVDALSAGGSTNHADAFTKATELLTPSSGNARVMVMFTDGKTTAGPNPAPIAAAARADGIVIYAIVQLDVRLRSVCPYKRVALAALLSEVDDEGNEYKRVMKTMTIPAHTRETCRDVTVRCINFVLPENLDVSGSPSAICNTRNFKARFIAHYVDNDFNCCDLTLQ